MAGGAPQFASLYVGDLHPDVTEAMLYEVFNSVGPVGSIRVCRDSVSRRSLGYAYVNFHSVKDAERALDTLNYSSIKGRSCRIMWSQRDPSVRKNATGNIFVKNLDPNIDNKALYDTFSLFGNILSCKVSADASGKSRGYGFVHFESEEAAKTAISKVDGMQIGEKTVSVAPFAKQTQSGEKEFTNIYVKHFPDEWEEAKLLEFFSAVGKVTSSCLMSDGKGRKFAFLNFEDASEAKTCVDEMNKKDMREHGVAEQEESGDNPIDHPSHLLYVTRAESKQERQRKLRDANNASAGNKGGGQGVNLFVKNLEEATDDAALQELFEPFGKITSVAAMKDSDGKCKGFGFVSYATPDEATKAVTEMHLKVVKGKPLYVGLAEKKEDRAERLRQRYMAGQMGGSKGKGSKGGGKGSGGMPQQGMMQPQMMGMMRPPIPGGGGQGVMPQMMGMMRPPMPGMMQQQMMGKGGPMPMMPNPQMMGMMGKGGMPGKPGMPMNPMGGMMPQGMMRPPMAGGMPGQMRPAMQGQQASPGAGPISAAALAAAPPGVQKQMLGEKLYPVIAKMQPELAGKITGMMLEMDNSELLILLESESQMKAKVEEAMRVLQQTK